MTTIPKLRHRSSVSKKAVGMPAAEIPYLIALVGGGRIRENHNAASDGFVHEAKRIGGAGQLVRSYAQIGKTSWRERALIMGVAVSLKKISAIVPLRLSPST